MTASEIRLVLTVGFDPRSYFPGGLNLFKLASKKLFGFFVCIIHIDHLLLYGKDLYVPSAAPLWHRDCAISLSIVQVTNMQIVANLLI